MKKYNLLFAASIFVVLTACKKENPSPAADTDPQAPALSQLVVNDLANNVFLNTYRDLRDKGTDLFNACNVLQSNTSDAQLAVCRTNWKAMRQAWEQSEGFLIGPVESENIDPRIDTWPVNFSRIDSVLSSPYAYTPGYVDSLEDALRGFHPLEYILFGQNGNKSASQLTKREKDLLVALAANIRHLSEALYNSWDPTASSNYLNIYTNPGNNAYYPSIKDIYNELMDACIGICDEVANGKIAEPFDQKNAALEESPFSSNSITDFTNNIISVRNIYFGSYGSADGKGLEDLIRQNNLDMDGKIKMKIADAINALNNVSVPFGQAINSQGTQIVNAQKAINDLKDYLEKSVKPYVQTLVQ